MDIFKMIQYLSVHTLKVTKSKYWKDDVLIAEKYSNFLISLTKGKHYDLLCYNI